MKHDISPTHTGLILGTFIAFLHLVWIVLVFFQLAQPLQDWVLGIHFLNNPFQVAPFDITTALTLFVVTFCVGFAGGFTFATIWNMVRKNMK